MILNFKKEVNRFAVELKGKEDVKGKSGGISCETSGILLYYKNKV